MALTYVELDQRILDLDLRLHEIEYALNELGRCCGRLHYCKVSRTWDIETPGTL